MSGEGLYPGWCCRQIAAQLSQALFTVADLHAQVSGLRDENRQLKLKIDSAENMKPQEDTSISKHDGKSTITNPVSDVPPLPNSMKLGEEAAMGANQLNHLNHHQEDVKDSMNINSSLDFKQERIILNIPAKQNPEDKMGELAHATTSQTTEDLRCEKCECSFLSADELTTHQVVHIGRSFHVCKVCNAMFLLKADLHRHLSTHPNIKQHICQLCGKAYTSKNNYKLHIKTHTGVGLYPCEVCGKAFHSENHLNVHRRIHTGERPYECQYCDKSFTQKSGLINHTRLHTGEKPFLCPSCPKAFTQKSNLNFHLSKHHPVYSNVPL